MDGFGIKSSLLIMGCVIYAATRVACRCNGKCQTLMSLSSIWSARSQSAS